VTGQVISGPTDEQVAADDLAAVDPGQPGNGPADPAAPGRRTSPHGPADADDGPASADGDVILSGLVVARKPASGQVALAGSGADDLDSAGLDLDVPEIVGQFIRAARSWAARRAFGLSSACGIWIAMAACAATWFSAGTRAGNFRAVAALWTGYLVLAAGQHLAKSAVRPAEAGPGTELARISSPFRRATATDRRAAGPVGWLAALGGCLAETVVYAGLALGAAAEQWPDAWALAIAVLGLSAVRNLMTACSTAPGLGAGPDSLLSRVTGAVVTMPAGGRILLVGVVAPLWGARAALLALLDWAIISIGFGLAGRARARQAASDTESPGRAETADIVRLRDDGMLARALGSLVRGGLLPLPPAILGLAAIAVLALVGQHSLAGALTIGPAIVMLLAAPGSGHPHGGRLDWLVPVLLLGAQLLYLSAAGHAARVPGPVTFALVAVLLLWYCDLASAGRPILLSRPRHVGDEAAERGAWLGWEGRLLVAGIGTAIGVATFAYLALTAYLGVLICAKVVTSCLAPREEDNQ
jgi:hypothetical protein